MLIYRFEGEISCGQLLAGIAGLAPFDTSPMAASLEPNRQRTCARGHRRGCPCRVPRRGGFSPQDARQPLRRSRERSGETDRWRGGLQEAAREKRAPTIERMSGYAFRTLLVGAHPGPPDSSARAAAVIGLGDTAQLVSVQHSQSSSDPWETLRRTHWHVFRGRSRRPVSVSWRR